MSGITLMTGRLTYKGIDFFFAFDKKELKLIPPEQKIKDIYIWFMKQLDNGGYVFGPPVYIEEKYLIGYCYEFNQQIIFFVNHSRLNQYSFGQLLKIEVKSYAIQKLNEENKISRLAFYGDEINYIYPVADALEYPEWSEKGNMSVRVKEFGETTSKPKEFFVNGKRVQVFFNIFRKISKQLGDVPLELKSSIIFEFEDTTDYIFILRLSHIAKEFIQFLCYRRDILIYNVDLFSMCQDGKYKKIGTLYENEDSINNEEKNFSRCINFECIHGFENKILNDIAEEKLYLRHIPSSYKSGRFIDSARFIMIVSAFEWIFELLYKDGIPKDDKRIKAENEVETEISELRNKATGKKKGIYKFLLKLVRTPNLSSKIIQVEKDYPEILNTFGNWLYSKNGETLNYSEIGDRLANQRNHFAHGELDKKFINLSLLDLCFLEYIVYALQLKYYNIDDKKIKKSIKNLFGIPIAVD